MGYFFAQKGSNCSTQSRKRSQTRAVESPEWFDCVEKRKIRAIRPRSCSFFSHRHVDDAVSRGISPRRIVIYGTTVPPRKEQSSSPRRDIAFYVLPPRDTRFVSLLFCCFVALCNRDDGLKSKMVSKSPLRNDVYASLTTRSYALYSVSNAGNVGF